MRPECPELRLTDMDRAFFRDYIAARLPDDIFDMHIHVNLPEHIPFMTEERFHSDWAFECGLILPYEKAIEYGKELFGGSSYSIAGFPWPVKEADLAANNSYLAGLKHRGLCTPFMGVSPEMSEEYIRQSLPDFIGFKPYPDRVSSIKGAEISIFSFMPRWQLSILNEARKAVVIHLPRARRIADPENIRELLEIRDEFPDITIIVAHFGRSYNPCYLQEAIEQMGEGVKGFYFDAAAVINPEVFRLAFHSLPHDRLLFGTDSPIMLWHGKRVWTEKSYQNLTSEPYSWNKHAEGINAESRYTLIVYESLRSILDAIDELGLGNDFSKAFFAGNARKLISRLMPAAMEEK